MSDQRPAQADLEVVLAQPRGFCAGVDRAIDIVERALELHGAPIYVRHEIVHNRYVVQDLKQKGATCHSGYRTISGWPAWKEAAPGYGQASA